MERGTIRRDCGALTDLEDHTKGRADWLALIVFIGLARAVCLQVGQVYVYPPEAKIVISASRMESTYTLES